MATENNDPEAQKAFDEGGSAGLMKFVQEKLDKWKTTEVNIAVVGQSGCGKSSFINALRGVHDYEDPKYAEVDVVECTMDPTEYEFPQNPLIKMWDIPGAGTGKFNASDYATEMKFSSYDAFVILSCDRFTEIDKMISEEANKLKKPFFFARTKMDETLKNQKKKLKKAFHRGNETERIKDNIKKKLGTSDDKIFLIVNLPADDDDLMEHFPDNDNETLKMTILKSLPNIQKTAIMFSMESTSDEMIDMKVKEISSRFEWLAILSAGAGAVPIPGVSASLDISILVTETLSQRKQLGIDADTMNKNAAQVGTDKDNILTEVKKQLRLDENEMTMIVKVIESMTGGISGQAAKAAAMITGIKGIETVAKYGSMTIPIIGIVVSSVLGAAISGGSTYYFLHKMLESHATLAKKCMKVFVIKAKEMKK